MRQDSILGSSLFVAEAIKASSGWKILAAMLFSELVIGVESDTFVEQRYVVGRAFQSGKVYRPVERN